MLAKRIPFAIAVAIALLCVSASLAIGQSVSSRSPRVSSDSPRVFAFALDTAANSAQSLSPATGPFPPRGDDATTSLGSFRIFVNPAFQSLMTGYPGYNSTTGRLSSPTLYDPSTKIGRSDPHLDGSTADAGGTPVGTAGTIISDSVFSLVPPGFEGPPGTREVHTEVRAFDLAGFGAHVRAGTAAPGRPLSPGEVQSKSGASGDPTLDFPAQSFFDIFVEVDLPTFSSFPGGTLYNPYPLLVVNNNLTQFPPRVVYIHGNTRAVPILFRDAMPGVWEAGDLFGWLVLAGHGISYNNSQQDLMEFQTFMQSLREMPLPCNALDFNFDGLVNLPDLSSVAPFWHDSARYEARHDVGLGGPDGVVAIDDLQRVGGCLGTIAAGSKDPIVIRKGDDLFESPRGQSGVAVPITNPIPSGFFGTKDGTPSDPAFGTIVLQGLPLITTAPTGSRDFQPVGPFNEVAQLARHGVLDSRQGRGMPDTIVRRLSDVTLGDPGTPPATGTIPIEIVALSLQSVQPIRVTYGISNAPSFFDVSVSLSPTTQMQGTMMVSRTSTFSGTFMSNLSVNSMVTFVNRAGPGGTDQPKGPMSRFDVFYSGMGTNSPLGSNYDTGAPTPWTLTPSAPSGNAPEVTVSRPSSASPQATPIVSVQPFSPTVDEGQLFTVSLTVSDVINLGAFEFTLAYSPTLVEVMTATMPLSSFLGSTGRSVAVPLLAPIISNTQGTIIYGAYSDGSQPGVNGNGVLAIVTLRARTGGTSRLTLLNTVSNPLELVDPVGNLLSVQSADGQVNIRRQVRLYMPVLLRN